jgi:6-phosphogluconolactonase (cycloisomerase 2 family)
VSTYSIDPGAHLAPITPAVGNGQSGSCWVKVSHDRSQAWVTNTGSGTISSYALADGAATLDAVVAATPGSGPIDLALTRDDRFLYVLLGATGSIASYEVQPDGSLVSRFVAGSIGLGAGAQGLVAF